MEKNNISAQTLNELLQNGDVAIIDVRSKDQYNFYHINNAYNIPIDDLSLSVVIKELEKNNDKSKIIVTYCNSGGRGGRAFEMLYKENTQSQYSTYNLEIKNLEHGINQWINSGYGIIKS